MRNIALKYGKGGHLAARELKFHCWRASLRITRCAAFAETLDRPFRRLRTACSLAADEAALILARFYMSPPAGPGRADSFLKTAFGIIYRSDSTFNMTPADMLVNSPDVQFCTGSDNRCFGGSFHENRQY